MFSSRRQPVQAPALPGRVLETDGADVAPVNAIAPSPAKVLPAAKTLNRRQWRVRRARRYAG